jgi:hypothetical protein
MKIKHVVFALSLLLLFVGCTKRNISDNEKKQALEDYTSCNQLANEWLNQLDSSHYYHLLSVKLPDGYQDNNFKEKTLAVINEAQEVYGKINSRKIIGAHFWSGIKLLTYAPNIEDKILNRIHARRSTDGFYIVNPRYFGLASSGQMFSDFPKGKYVILMYQSSPTNKSYAEEKLTLWYNPQGSWQVLDYEISEDCIFSF